MPRSLFPAATPSVRARLEQDEALKLINDYDWSTNILGPMPHWPESLKGAVRMIMAAAMPMVVMIGPKGILVYNSAYAKFAEPRHPRVFGMPALDAWPELAAVNRSNIERGLRGEAWSMTSQLLNLERDGRVTPVWMDLIFSPVLGEDGVPLGTLCMIHETTERTMAEKALARSEERLSLALNGSNLVGTWDWNVPEDLITSDDKFAEMYGFTPQQADLGVPLASFLAAIHPGDIERVRGDIEASLGGAQLNCEYRLLSPDGSIRWVVASGQARLGADGRAQRFPGVVFDISEQRRIRDALAESETRFRTLADTMPQMVWSTLPDGFHDYFNARWYEYTGAPRGTTQGPGWDDIVEDEDRAHSSEAWAHSLATGEPYHVEYRLRHHSGAYRWTLALALPVRDAEGNVVRWFGTCTDIHETRLLAEERELVAQELSHRIKNIFAVLTGIISLSARSRPEVKPFADELRQRIYALGEANDFVRPQNHVAHPPDNQGSLKSLIERLMRPYNRGEDARILYLGDDAVIDDGAATPVALLFHELATNAAKYGALSAGEGRVELTGRTENERFHLTWKEIGGPKPAGENELSGFGSRLIGLSVEGQLGGTLERVWEVDGLRVEIDLHADALRRSARLRS